MAQRITATAAKNNFGGLIDLVAARGRVEITKHGRVVAVVMTPELADGRAAPDGDDPWGREHMIPADRARAARIVRRPDDFDGS